jgi:hypothetical protein
LGNVGCGALAQVQICGPAKCLSNVSTDIIASEATDLPIVQSTTMSSRSSHSSSVVSLDNVEQLQ